MAPTNPDPFDDLLTIEDTLYTTAHSQGVSDGARAGRIEGRIFGLEKGFEKYAALGELHGRGAVWGSRIAIPPTPTTSTPTTTSAATPALTNAPKHTNPLPAFPTTSSRLGTNISLLYHLTDPLTFSTSNTESSVADFDDRFKRAGAKAKVVERIIGESAIGMEETTGPASSSKNERSVTPRARNVRLEGEATGKRGGQKGDDSMEDFGGSRLII
ncbi:ORAOV1 family protein [Stagonosporopsis vannaccii]|nr:ORAOV1 family protein [Stagonosporopsis vannaccii]